MDIQIREIRGISEISAKYYKLPLSQIMRKTRMRYITEKRQTIHALCVLNTKASLKKIGINTSHQDHATVYYSKKTIFNLIEQDSRLKDDFDNINKLIKRYLKGVVKEIITIEDDLLEAISYTESVNMRIQLRTILKKLMDGEY